MVRTPPRRWRFGCRGRESAASVAAWEQLRAHCGARIQAEVAEAPLRNQPALPTQPSTLAQPHE